MDIAKKLDAIKEQMIQETYNPNDFAWEYSREYVAKLHRVVPTNPFNAMPLNPEDTEEFEFIQELKFAVHEEEHEVEIEYEDGNSIILDVEVVKHLLANCSTEQLLWAKESSENMTSLLVQMCGEIVTLDNCDEYKKD